MQADFKPSLRSTRKKQRGPTDHPHHVEGAVEDVLLAGGKLVSVQLHRYRLSQQRDEEPQIGGGVEKEFNHRDLQDLSGLVKKDGEILSRVQELKCFLLMRNRRKEKKPS